MKDYYGELKSYLKSKGFTGPLKKLEDIKDNSVEVIKMYNQYMKSSIKKSELKEVIRQEILSIVKENNVNEMAKIAGELESAIIAVINANPTLSGLALRKAIKSNEAVLRALGGDALKDNQLNRFIDKYKSAAPANATTLAVEPDTIEEPEEEEEEVSVFRPEPEPEAPEAPSTTDIAAGEKEFGDLPSRFKISQDKFEDYQIRLRNVVKKIKAMPKNSPEREAKLTALKQFIKNPELVRAYDERGVEIDTDGLIG